MAKKLTPLKSTGDFLKNVAGTPYRKAKKQRFEAEKYLPGKIEKLKKADAALLQDLLKHKDDKAKAADINKKMDLVERNIFKYQQNLSDARHRLPEVEGAAKASMNKARKQLAIGGGIAAGTIASGLIAKKLYDKHKEKKEEEKTAFEALDDMVKEAFTYHPQRGFHLNQMDEVRAYESLIPKMKSLPDFQGGSKRQFLRAERAAIMHNVGVLKKHGFKGKRLTTKQWASQPLSPLYLEYLKNRKR